MTMIGRMLILALALAGVWPAVAAPADEQWTLWMDTGKAMQQAKRWDEAAMAFRQAITISDAFPIEDKRVLNSYLGLYMCYRAAKTPDLTEGVGALCIARLEKAYGENAPRVSGFLFDNAARFRNDMERAAGLLRWALTAREKAVGPDDPALVEILRELGGRLYREEGRPYLLRAVAIMEKAYGLDDPRLIPALSSLADAGRKEHSQESAALYQRILDIAEASLWPDDPCIYRTLHWQSSLYGYGFIRQRYPEALLIQQRLARRQEQADPMIFLNYGPPSAVQMYLRLGYYAEAQAALERPGYHAEKELGDLAMEQARFAAAEEYYRTRVQLAEEVLAKQPKQGQMLRSNTYHLAQTLTDLATALLAQGKEADAQQTLARAGAFYAKADDSNVLYRLLTAKSLDEEEAESHARWAQVFTENHGLENIFTIDHYRQHGRYLMAVKQPARAEAPLQTVVDTWEGMLGPRHRRLVHPLAELAACKAAQGKREEADALYRRALTIAEGAYGAEDTLTAAIRKAGGTVLAPGAR